MPKRSTAIRIFLTGFLIFCAHFSSNVVRETYLALALAEDRSVRVDQYLGLHPDLFEIEGRGAYINSNPGASILGAVPLAVASPILGLLYRARPGLVAPKPAATYDDPRPNRDLFMNRARERGLDIHLGLAAAVTQVGLMAPTSALAMVLMYFLACARFGREREATWLALLYGFGTPIFFRTAFLNQNLLVAHLVLVGFALLAWPGTRDDADERRRELGVGLCAGMGLLLDYSAAPIAVAFGTWIMARRLSTGGIGRALSAGVRYTLGAAGPVALLFGYQAWAFGAPWFPAQRYMDPTEFSVLGWNGMTLPTAELLFRNLFSLNYGLFAFCPLLIAAFAAPFVDRDEGGPTGSELALIFGATGALWLFNSANQFSHLQFNTGVRYMVPIVPLLFFATIPVLRRVPRIVAWALLFPTLVISAAIAMTRENVVTALTRVFLLGPELPWVTVLRKMASGYAPGLADGVSPLMIFFGLGVIVWLIWRGGDPTTRLGSAVHDQ